MCRERCCKSLHDFYHLTKAVTFRTLIWVNICTFLLTSQTLICLNMKIKSLSITCSIESDLHRVATRSNCGWSQREDGKCSHGNMKLYCFVFSLSGDRSMHQSCWKVILLESIIKYKTDVYWEIAACWVTEWFSEVSFLMMLMQEVRTCDAGGKFYGFIRWSWCNRIWEFK